MKIFKRFMITTVASLIIGICMFAFLPKCFYSKIGLVSSGSENGTSFAEIGESAEVSFICQQRYIDSLILYICDCEDNTYLDFSIVDSHNRKKYKANELVYSDMYITLPIKKNFALNETYKLIINNNSATSVKLKNCIACGPSEEINVCIDGEITGDLLDLTFMYGLYSKKYLIMVYLWLWCGCYILITACENRLSKLIEKKEQ